LRGFLLRWFFNTVAIYATTRIISGLQVPEIMRVVAAVTPLAIANFWAAFIGALLIAIISTLLSRLLTS